jgi:ATP-dependent protease ClpP protease subunit
VAKIPNPLFRENFQRCIHVSGEIDQTSLDRLSPEIQRLRGEGGDPITVFVDCPGGSTWHAEALLRLLKATTQDGVSCRILTVVTTLAASAAADLLAAGDYSIAYPSAVILYHGIRSRTGQAVTTETASQLVETLRKTSEDFALQLANRCIDRFFFNYAGLMGEFSDIREEQNNPRLHDIDCLSVALQKRLPNLSRLPTEALGRRSRNAALSSFVSQKLNERADITPETRRADAEAGILQAIVQYELDTHPEADWTLASDGMRRVQEDFVLLREYHSPEHNAKLASLISQYGAFMLTPEEQQHYNGLTEPEKQQWLSGATWDRVHALWYFYVSICRLLQEGENYMSPEEAYWLGIVDEVIGSPLPSIRTLVEKDEAPPTDESTVDVPNS